MFCVDTTNGLDADWVSRCASDFGGVLKSVTKSGVAVVFCGELGEVIKKELKKWGMRRLI